MRRSRVPNSRSIRDVEESFKVSPGRMRRVIRDFHAEMEKGLAGRGKGSLKMIPSYVDRPTGEERGKFMALDLGGTNFRVFEVILKGGGRSVVAGTKGFALKRGHITGTAGELFGFVADCIKEFLAEQKERPSERLDLGFTFSFPVMQTGIASGALKRWTKGFTAKGVEGEDVVRLLNEALEREGLGNIRVTALANDTVGTLVARSYEDRACDVAVILGTGTNACYPEELARIPKWKGEATRSGRMIINIEWGNFDKLDQTVYDKELDGASENKGEQILEKMVSGMYLGEMTRLILKDLTKRGLLFGARPSSALATPGAFRSEHVSRVEADVSKGLDEIEALLKELGVSGSTLKERRLIKKVCGIVSTRAARISASAIGAVVTRIDPAISRPHTIAIDGSVYEKHPRFSARMKAAVRELFGRKSANIKLVLAPGGSGKGSAIIAAMARGPA